MLLLDRNRRIVWLTEQFRYPTLAKGPGWLQEIPAGTCNDGETPLRAARRELREELGIAASELQHIARFYVSPGGSSERVTLFFGVIDSAKHPDRTPSPDPDEDIRAVERKLEDFIKDASAGKLEDAKTLIAGLWLIANRKKLRI